MNRKKKVLTNVLRLAWVGLCIYVAILSTIHVLPNLVDYIDLRDLNYDRFMTIDLIYDSDIYYDFMIFLMAYMLNLFVICNLFELSSLCIEYLFIIKRLGFKGFKRYMNISSLRSDRKRTEFIEADKKAIRKQKMHDALRKKYSKSPLPYLFLGLFLGFIFFK